MFGIRHVVLAVNKMDLMDYSEDRFSEISEAYVTAAQALNFDTITCIPVSALKGDNLRKISVEMASIGAPLFSIFWIFRCAAVRTKALPLPIQWISRPMQTSEVIAAPSLPGRFTCKTKSSLFLPLAKRVDRIVTMDADRESAQAGDAITLTFTDEVDAQRGDVIAPSANRRIAAISFAYNYYGWIKNRCCRGATTRSRSARKRLAVISDLRYTINVNTAEQVAARTMNANEIGVCNISLQRTVAFDPYESNKQTGAFILIDRYTKQTVAAGRSNTGCGVQQYYPARIQRR